MKHHILFIAIFFSITLYAQKLVGIDNIEAISGFYKKLNALENGNLNKLRITQIGDSHIQTTFFTGRIRHLLQDKFGNAGVGFVFPYKLAKTNGSNVKFTSNADFEATRNIFADSTNRTVGLSGYSLISKTENTVIKLSTVDFPFNTIKIISPENATSFKIGNYNANKDFNAVVLEKSTKNYIVKAGDNLYKIAKKFKTTIKHLKANNKLKTSLIYPGKKLKIEEQKITKPTININDFEITPTTNQEFTSNKKINNIYIFNSNKGKNSAINGIVLENTASGIIYNGIGVNGARCKDYNKFDMFTEQLKSLESNLIIISLGTNESFNEISTNAFLEQFLLLINTIKTKNPNAEILVTTPPPSLLKRRYKNKLIVSYIKVLKENMFSNNYAVWDLYHAFGAHENILKNYRLGLVSKDKIHYTKLGYQTQADLLFSDLMQQR